jgi:hypothetical protein
VEYDEFLIRLYHAPALHDTGTLDRYQAQVLYPPSADSGRAPVCLTSSQLRWLLDQSAALRAYAGADPLRWRGVGHVTRDEAVRGVAHQLRNSLPAEVYASLHAALSAALEHGRGLRIGLLIDPEAEDLAGLPWEMLWDVAWPGGYLAQSPFTPVVRLLETTTPPPRWRTGDRRALRSNNGHRLVLGWPRTPPALQDVLVVIVGADATTRVAGAEQEAQHIQQALEGAAHRHVTVLGPPTSLAALHTALAARPYQAIHFIAHGGVHTSPDLAYLLFDRAAAQTDPTVATDPTEPVVGARLLALLQGQPALELLVFSVCRSADPLVDDPPATRPLTNGVTPGASRLLTASLGPQIAAASGLAVIAMQFDILAPIWAGIEPERSWAYHFYAQLGNGAGLEAALAAARKALTVDNDPVLWAAPVLYVPLYWPRPPAPLYQRLDERVYRAVAASMEDNGDLLQEGLLFVGLFLAAALLWHGLLALPLAGATASALLAAASAVLGGIIVLPLLLAGSALVLEARHRPFLGELRGRAALALALTAYGGAGLGVVLALTASSGLALLLHYLGLHHPLLRLGVSGLLIAGSVGVGVSWAGRFLRVYKSVSDLPRLQGNDWWVGLAPLPVGFAAAVFLPLVYEWLGDPARGLAVLAVGFILFSLWHLRRPPPPPGS